MKKYDLKTTLIIIIVSAIILLSIVGYLFISRKYNKKTAVKDTENNVEYLSTTFMNYGPCSTGKQFNLSENDLFDLNDLSNDDVNNIVYNYINNYIGINKNNINPKTNLISVKISSTNIINTVTKIFGQEYANSYKMDTLERFNNNMFTLKDGYYEGDLLFDACLDEMYPQYYKYNSYFDKEKYNVEYALYYLKQTIPFESSTVNIIKYAYVDSNQESPTCLETEVEDNLDKLTKYRFVFKKENDNFIFDHVELVK